MGGGGAKPFDAQQLRQLVDAHGAALALYARQWCREPEDAVQEALVDLLRQAPAPDNPAAWLFVTVRRRAMNLARAGQRRDELHRRAGERREQWFQPDEESGFEPHELEALLAGLPPLEREIVVARIWGGLTLEQTARLVEQSSSTIHRRYQRALEMLGEKLNGKLNESR